VQVQVQVQVGASCPQTLCDATLRTSSGGVWSSLPCHASLLAALSPLLRAALQDLPGEEEVVVVCEELEGDALLSLLYTGAVECSSRAGAAALWGAVQELGVEGALSLTRAPRPPPPPRGAVMHILLGVEQEQVQEDVKEQVVEEVKVRRVREAGGYLECEECDLRFTSETNLRCHTADLHSLVRCAECGVEVQGSSRLVQHTATTHPTLPPPHHPRHAPTCDICHETFVTNQALKFHLYKHSGLKPFKCHVCQTSFRTPSTLKSHIEVQHTESKHRCKVCGMKCSTSGKLRIHMRTHTDEKPHRCSYCAAAFRQLSVLRVHEFRHTQRSAHRCARCAAYFPTRSRLVAHASRPVCAARGAGGRRARRPRGGAVAVAVEAIGEGVTYLIQSSPLGEPAELVGMAGYQGAGLAELGAEEMPVLVDTLPVIVQGAGEEELARGHQIMFTL